MRAVAIAALLLGLSAAPAAAQVAEPELQYTRLPQTITGATGTLIEPPSYAVPPPGRRMSARQVIAVAAAVPKVRATRAQHPRAYVRAYLVHGGRWQYSVFDADRHEIAQVLVDDRDGRVLEAWTGVQVEWPMARGYPGAFGQAVNAPWVWIGLCVLFALPFARPPLRLMHLDLAVLLAFSVSYAFFQDANLGVSVPSAYPLLAYLLVRMLIVAARPQPPPRLLVGPGFLLAGVAFLAAFHVALNVTNGNVIDVGYASVIGADHLAADAPLYGAFPLDNPNGDTYGPALYAAYVPFEQLFPWTSGTWDDLPAAHAAAIAFDLGVALLLYLLVRRERGLLLAYLWLAFPFTLMVANSGSNDALVALLILAALLAISRPLARGGLAALAGLTKLAPLALAPMFVATVPGRIRAALGYAAVAAIALAPFDLSKLYDATVRFQATRESPFSIWHDLPAGFQTAAQVAAVALAVVVAFVPRRRDVRTLAALAAAVLIATQIAVEHWFYLYLVWFAPLMWVALLAPPARSSPPAGAATPG